jgi:hypothetical protein
MEEAHAVSEELPKYPRRIKRREQRLGRVEKVVSYTLN